MLSVHNMDALYASAFINNMKTVHLIIISALCGAFFTITAHSIFNNKKMDTAYSAQLDSIESQLKNINNQLLNINIRDISEGSGTDQNTQPLKQLIADVVTETLNTLPQNTGNTPATPKPEYLPEHEQQARYDAAQLWINQQLQAGSFSMDALSSSHVTDGLPPQKVTQLVAGVMRRIKSGELQESDVFK
jgi:hypothetical protein